MIDHPEESAPCLYCGKTYPLGAERCPHCRAPTHARPHSRIRRFRWFFVLLAVACLILVFWLPR